MTLPHSPSPPPSAPPSPVAPVPGGFALLGQAMGDARRLFFGREGRRRWPVYSFLCAMAGVVGAGAAPPPLGLLPSLWANPEIRQPVAGNPVVMGGLFLLAAVLLLFGAVARAFTFAFMEGLSTEAPQAKAFREYLRPGTAHYVWSSLLTLPMYALLFLGEAAATHGIYVRFAQLLANPPDDAPSRALLLLGEGVLRFALVLAPWTLLTLPAFVLLYELTPATMWAHQLGPAAACGRALGLARKAPRLFWSYLGVRMVLQLVGNVLASFLLIPSLLISALPGGLLLGLGWGIAALCGGPATSGGVAALTVTGLLAVVLLYGVLCHFLSPFSGTLYRMALRVADGE